MSDTVPWLLISCQHRSLEVTAARTSGMQKGVSGEPGGEDRGNGRSVPRCQREAPRFGVREGGRQVRRQLTGHCRGRRRRLGSQPPAPIGARSSPLFRAGTPRPPPTPSLEVSPPSPGPRPPGTSRPSPDTPQIETGGQTETGYPVPRRPRPPAPPGPGQVRRCGRGRGGIHRIPRLSEAPREVP